MRSYYTGLGGTLNQLARILIRGGDKRRSREEGEETGVMLPQAKQHLGPPAAARGKAGSILKIKELKRVIMSPQPNKGKLFLQPGGLPSPFSDSYLEISHSS